MTHRLHCAQTQAPAAVSRYLIDANIPVRLVSPRDPLEPVWKAVMHAAHDEGRECASPRQAFRVAFALGWITDDALWLGMLEDRNRTSHTYNEATAEEIYTHLANHVSALGRLLETLRSGLAPPSESA